jgi:hypothetical protein
VIATCVAATVAAVLWSSGAFDEPLADVGLNSRTCAENLFGAKMCGDELVAFCKERYDPDLNADTCDESLREAGVLNEVKAGLAAREAREQHETEERIDRELAAQERVEREKAREAERRARTPARFAEPATLGDVVYNIESITTSAELNGAFDVQAAGADRTFVIANMTYRNVGEKPLDLLCAGGNGFALIDVRGRRFSADDDVMFEAAANDEACAGDIQPGDQGDAVAVFNVRDNVRPAQLVVWDPQGDAPEDGGKHLVYDIPR